MVKVVSADNDILVCIDGNENGTLHRIQVDT